MYQLQSLNEFRGLSMEDAEAVAGISVIRGNGFVSELKTNEIPLPFLRVNKSDSTPDLFKDALIHTSLNGPLRGMIIIGMQPSGSIVKVIGSQRQPLTNEEVVGTIIETFRNLRTERPNAIFERCVFTFTELHNTIEFPGGVFSNIIYEAASKELLHAQVCIITLGQRTAQVYSNLQKIELLLDTALQVHSEML